MVNSTTVQSSRSNIEYQTLNPSQIFYISTSGLGQLKKQQSSTKDRTKIKLTARVVPMTRENGNHADKTEKRTSGDLQKTTIPENPLVSPVCTDNSAPSMENVISAVKIEHFDAPVCQASSVWKRTNYGKHKAEGEHFHMEPKAKQRRAPTSAIHALSHHIQHPGEPLYTPEPKLLGDNIATLSLLSASQGHRATLQDEDGDTPLHIAIAQGQVQLVQYLIHVASTSCISLDIYNKLKQTPLHLAVITNQPFVVRSLINAGVDANIQDRNGQTAVHLACQRSTVECLMELVNARQPLNLEAKNFSGSTPLHEAVISNSPDIIRFLISCGANLDSKDGKSGRTPLHFSVELELLPVIELLICSGASVSAASYAGNTPLQTASGRGMHQVTRLLLGTTNDVAGRDSRHDPSKYKMKNSMFRK